MNQFSVLLEALPGFIPVVAVVAVTVVTIWVVRRMLFERVAALREQHFSRQVTLAGIGAAGVVMAVIALPATEETRVELLRLLGLIVSAVVAFSSTTLVSNAMAGVMLRAIGSFRAGDFIRVGSHFGRVTERGLLHTEIQSTNRDLVTLPNLFLVSNPVTVVRTSGTVVSAEVSIGYDTAHGEVEALLLDAARGAELEEPFVQILELGNFAVTYRVAGFRKDIRYIVSAATALRRAVLDTLHAAGVEIASPTLMVQRPLAAGERIVPARSRARLEAEPEVVPEDRVFDKADEAEAVSRLEYEKRQLEARVRDLESLLRKTEGVEHAAAAEELATCRARLEQIPAELARVRGEG